MVRILSIKSLDFINSTAILKVLQELLVTSSALNCHGCRHHRLPNWTFIPLLQGNGIPHGLHSIFQGASHTASLLGIWCTLSMQSGAFRIYGLVVIAGAGYKHTEYWFTHQVELIRNPQHQCQED